MKCFIEPLPQIKNKNKNKKIKIQVHRSFCTWWNHTISKRVRYVSVIRFIVHVLQLVVNMFMTYFLQNSVTKDHLSHKGQVIKDRFPCRYKKYTTNLVLCQWWTTMKHPIEIDWELDFLWINCKGECRFLIEYISPPSCVHYWNPTCT